MRIASSKSILAAAIATMVSSFAIGLAADPAEAGGRGRKSPRVAGFVQTANGNDNGNGLMPRSVFGSIDRVHGRTASDRFYRQLGYQRP